MAQPVQPLTYSVVKAAELLGVGRNQAYEAVRTGEIPSIRIGKRILVPRIALENLLKEAASGRTEKAAEHIRQSSKPTDEENAAFEPSSAAAAQAAIAGTASKLH